MSKITMDTKIHQHDKMYGTTTIGARGQVVIPAQARKDLKLKPGDQFIVMGKFGKLVALVKTDQLTDLIETVISNIANPARKKEVRKHMQQVVGKQFIK